ncbi:hypothetical protein BDV12DRAFT_202118 [Aspergillus spectabilis]
MLAVIVVSAGTTGVLFAQGLKKTGIRKKGMIKEMAEPECTLTEAGNSIFK